MWFSQVGLLQGNGKIVDTWETLQGVFGKSAHDHVGDRCGDSRRYLAQWRRRGQCVLYSNLGE